MKFLTGTEILDAIKQNNMLEIAVAQIGSDWESFLSSIDNLDFVIISPTLGTNPKAVTDLARKIGWEKVLFLNELNAKIYLGNKSAIIGSVNLTKNSLSGDALIEACVEVCDEENLYKIRQMMDKLIYEAKLQYPTLNAKKKQLVKLERTWGAAIANRVTFYKNQETSNFLDLDILGSNQFYVLWYMRTKGTYSDELETIQNKIEDELHFQPSDNVEENKWALIWEITSSYKPHMGQGRLKWLFIHDIYENGILDEGYAYTTCAIQRNDRPAPAEPFKITKEVENTFKKAIINPDIAKYFIQKNVAFDLNYSFQGFTKLIETMKNNLRSASLNRIAG